MIDTPDTPDSETWLTVGEIAARLRLSKMSVHRLINSGALPARRFGRSLRVRTDEFDTYVDASKVGQR